MEIQQQRLENLKNVLSRANDPALSGEMTPRELASAFQPLADEPYRIGFNFLYPTTFASMLHRLEDLKPGVRADFEAALLSRLAASKPVREKAEAGAADREAAGTETKEEPEAPTGGAEAAAGSKVAGPKAAAPPAGGSGFRTGYVPKQEDLFDRFLTLVSGIVGKMSN